MLQAKEIKELQRGTWELGCPNMVLHKNAINNEDTYVGAGYIRRTKNGDLSFKLYSQKEVKFLCVLGSESVKSGELIPDDEYYELFATDVKGREWKSKYILADTGGVAGQKGAVTSGMLEDLKNTSKSNLSHSQTKSRLNIKFFGDFKIPCNAATELKTSVAGHPRRSSASMNVAKFASCGYDFEISSENGIVNLRVDTNSGKFSQHLEVRVIEALQFVLARMLQWTVMEKCEEDVETIRIKRTNLVQNKWQIGPPLSFRTVDPSGLVWKLYDKYLAHILNYTERDKYHPLSVFVNKAIQGSAGSIETQSLALCVSVEGVLQTEFPNLGVLSDAESKQLNDIVKLIEEHVMDDALKGRIKSAIGSWKKPSATDKLLHLIQANVIEKADYDAWKKLRNPATHGSLPNLKNLQEFMDLCHTVTVLFYKLIFHAIGYKGKYTDYSTRGWLLRDYPCDGNEK